MTLQQHLQRLSGTKLDAVGAANAWAGTKGLELLGALNAKAGTKGLGLNEVVRRLSGGKGEATAEISKVTGNLAFGKPATCNLAVSSGTLAQVTDGVTGPTGAATDAGLGRMTVDLGSAVMVDTIKVWHYHADGRTYLEPKLEVSTDNATWTTLYESVNLLANPGYETALVNTSGYGGLTVSQVTPGRTGTSAAEVTTTGTGAQGFIHLTPLNTSVASGTTVKCGAWVKVASGRGLTISGRLTAPDGTYIGEGRGSTNFIGTGAWQYVETAAWTHTAVFRPGFQITSSGVSGLVIQVDDSFAGTVAAAPYAETVDGKTHTFAAMSVRYIRDSTNGSSVNTGNHWVEIQAFAPAATSGQQAEPDPPAPVADKASLPLLMGMRL